jgi:hypothetical protein
MKKITLLFLVILFVATYTLHAQKTFAGVIQFEMKFEGSDDPNLISSIEDFDIITTILGNKIKTAIKPNEMVELTQIWDGDKGTFITVFEMTGLGKLYKKWDQEQYKEKIKYNENSFSYKNEYKDILGYKCQKVVVTTTNLEDDAQTETVLYVTKDIGSPKINGAQFAGLEGYPLMVFNPTEQHCEGCGIATQAVKITPKQKIKDVEFLLPADAKNIEDEPDLKEMFKGLFDD